MAATGGGAVAVPAKASFAADNKISVLLTGAIFKAAHRHDVMFCGCEDVVNVVDMGTGKLLRTLAGDSEPVMSIAVSPDDSMVVVSSRSRMVRVFDWLTAECVRSFKAHDAPILAMAIDQTSTLLATASADSTVKVWDLHKGYCTHNFKGSMGIVTHVMFHHTDLQLFSCAADGHIRWWDLTTSKPVAVLKGHNSVVRGLALLPDGATLISGGRDQVVLVWDLKRKKNVKTIAVLESVESVTYVPQDIGFEFESTDVDGSPEGQFITAGDKGELRVWNMSSGECVHTEKATSPITNCFLDPRLGRIIATTQDQMILFFEQSSLQRTKQIMGSYDEVIDVKLIGETQSHVAIATNLEYIQLLDTATLDSALLAGHTDIVLTLDVSSDGLVMVSGSKDNSIRLWGADDEGLWRCVGSGVGHAGNVSAVALPRKKVGFVLSGSKDCTIKYWMLKPDVLSVTGKAVHKLSTKYTRKGHDKEINCLTCAPNDKMFVSGGQDRLAKIWNTEDGELVGALRGHKRGVWDAQFSTVDQVVATASGDATVKIWSVASLSCLKTFEGHESSVLRVRFLTRGTQLLTTGSDGLMKLWNIKKNEEIKTIDAHDGRVWALSVSADEGRVVTGAQDGTVVIWRDSTKEEMAQKYAEEERVVVLSQDLRNLLAQKKYKEAAELALELKRPYEMLKIVEKVLLEEESTPLLTTLVDGLSLEQTGTLLEYSQDWNTDARHVSAAQTVLHVVLHTTPLAELAKLPRIGRVVTSLIAYSERHFKRFAKLQQNAKLIDFTYISLKPAENPMSIAAEADGSEADGSEAEAEVAEVAEAPAGIEDGEDGEAEADKAKKKPAATRRTRKKQKTSA